MLGVSGGLGAGCWMPGASSQGSSLSGYEGMNLPVSHECIIRVLGYATSGVGGVFTQGGASRDPLSPVAGCDMEHPRIGLRS